MDIWHVANKKYTRLILWRTDPNTFRVTQDGDYKPLLDNGIYTLIDKKYAPLFKQLPDQVSLHEVKIVDFEFNTETDNYIELKPYHEITPASIKLKDSTGLKIWGFNGHIFVSGDLKSELIEISAKEFDFNLGFSRFAG